MIAHHAWLKPGKPIERPWPDAANESKTRQCAYIGKPGVDGAVDKIRLVLLGRDDLCLLVVKSAVGLTLDRLSYMAIVARLPRRDSRHDVGAMHEAEGGSCRTDSREWKTANGELALRSQVWGEWVPDADNYRHLQNEDGEILWAAPDWLDRTLPKFDRQLVYTVTLQKYKSSRSYSDASGAKAIYVGTRPAGKSIRFWFAKKASATIY